MSGTFLATTNAWVLRHHLFADQAKTRARLLTVNWRIVNSTVGRPIMEAHRTPDDRAATPTVVALDDHNQFLGAWVERPAELQALVLEQQKIRMRREVTEIKTKWYEKDAGRSTVSEVMALFAKSR